MSVSERNIDKVAYSKSTVITEKIEGFTVKRIIMDKNISHDIPFVNTLLNMGLDWNRPAFHTDMVVYFAEEKHHIIGNASLPLTLRESPKLVTQKIYFAIIDFPTPYDGALEKLSQDLFRIILSEGQHLIKFQTNQGAGCIQGNSTTIEGHRSMPKGDNLATRDPTIDMLDIREDLHTQR